MAAITIQQPIRWLAGTLSVFLILATSTWGTADLRSVDPQPYRLGPEHAQPRVLSGDRTLLYVENSVQNIWMYRPYEYRIDAEVYQMTLKARTKVHRRLELSLSIPVRYLSGGFLDGVIEGFHNRLGFDDADRSEMPRSDLAVEIGNSLAGTEYSPLEGQAIGWSLAEPVLEFNYVIPINFMDVAAHGYSRLPVRSGPEDLTGYLPSVGLSLAVGKQFGGFYSSLSYSAGHVSQSEFLGVSIRDRVHSTVASLEYHSASRRHTWWVQGIVQSGIATDLTGLADRRHQILLGYSVRVGPDWQLEFGLLENLLRFDNTPDVGLHFGVTRPLGF
jgi:hypothetical protein